MDMVQKKEVLIWISWLNINERIYAYGEVAKGQLLFDLTQNSRPEGYPLYAKIKDNISSATYKTIISNLIEAGELPI